LARVKKFAGDVANIYEQVEADTQSAEENAVKVRCEFRKRGGEWREGEMGI
jgi:hypothetical protein